MKSPFIEKLLTFYREDPNDPFNLYALTLEYQKIDITEAEKLYKKLLHDHPEYLPTYYQAAQFFIGIQDNDRAIEAFREGIDLAIRQKNNKTQTELTRARQAFEDEQMD
ncbi:tetratricopeptide repeat protein [Persicitalea sp.]|uniref:tetratricopeptide repeat protein n=1 Tax=Persicitalea sp. TaxID=3100273 RepID=UPI003593CDC6